MPSSHLVRLTDRVWFLPHDEPTDRPVLGYIRGDRLSLAVDAGASPAHVADFYRALADEGLPLPDATAITHWHWDHTFGMACVHGLTIASRATCGFLRAERKSLQQADYLDGMRCDTKGFALEFPPGTEPTVVLPDIQFEGDLTLELGGVTAQLMQTVSPHTDDAVLVYIPEERVVFLGDAACAGYDAHRNLVLDHAKLAALASTVNALDCDWYQHGHWEPLDKEGVAEDFDPQRVQ